MAMMLMRAPAGASQVLLRDGSVLQVQASGLCTVDPTLAQYGDLLAIGFVPLDPQSPQYLTQVGAGNPVFAVMPF